jgi:cation transport regulator ChaC
MDALIVYGSLINNLELTKGGFPLYSTRPVVLQGFKRVFCQEPS